MLNTPLGLNPREKLRCFHLVENSNDSYIFDSNTSQQAILTVDMYLELEKMLKLKMPFSRDQNNDY